MITVEAVDTAKRLRQFIDLPFRLYADDQHWVAPLRSDMKRILSPRHNPFFREAQIEHFLALDDQGQAQGRVSVCIHAAYNLRFGHEHVFFGFFEVAPDPAVTRALFDAVGKWARARGKSRLLGPYSYTSTQDAALLLENIDGRPPTLLQTYNPLWYADALKQAGFDLAFTFSTYGVDVEQYRARRKASRSEKVLPGSQFSVRSATRADLRSNLEEIRCLFNSAFAENYEVAPISKASFKFQIDSVKTFIDLEGIKLIELDGRAVAFFLILPDLNQILSRLKGHFGLFDLFKLNRYKRGVTGGVIALIGADPSVQGSGLGRLIGDEIVRYAEPRFQRVDTMWIDDRNPSSYVLARNVGMRRTKRYGVFGLNLDQTPG
jgi:GNAT superfamily N-acetyltransferase